MFYTLSCNLSMPFYIFNKINNNKRTYKQVDVDDNLQFLRHKTTKYVSDWIIK